jgi:hypothetical protein
MSLFVYRFRLRIPVLETQLEVEVGDAVTIDDHAGGEVVDVECDDSKYQDLLDAMESRGYEFVEGSPSTTAEEGFRTGNNIVGIDAHKTLRQLIHFINDGPTEGFASGAFKEIIGTTFPTAIVWYTDSGKTDKIVERLITWSGTNVTVDKWKIYDTDGSTVLWTVTDSISYSGIFETDRTRAIASGDA